MGNKHIIDAYRESFLMHGDTPEGVKWSSDGQLWRFKKLIEIIPIQMMMNRRLKFLEIGSGLGHFYEFLLSNGYDCEYTGVDIVPEFVNVASKKHRLANFICCDILEETLIEKYDFVFLSGIFNAPRSDKLSEVMLNIINKAYSYSTYGMAFNFTSSYVNFQSPSMNYYDPCIVMRYIVEKLTPKVVLYHHYQNCDVCIHAYRQ